MASSDSAGSDLSLARSLSDIGSNFEEQGTSGWSDAVETGGSDWRALFNPEVERALDVKALHTLPHDSPVCCVAFSLDGTIVATGCKHVTSLYNSSSGEEIALLAHETSDENENPVRGIAFSPDGLFLATGSEDSIVRLWDLQTHQIVKTFLGHSFEIYTLSFLPTDPTLLISAAQDGSARLWNISTGELIRTFTLEDSSAIVSLAVSSDGKWLATGGFDKIVRIWEIQSGRIVASLLGHGEMVHSVAFSKDGSYLVSASWDRFIYMWGLEALKAFSSSPEVPDEVEIPCKNILSGHEEYVLSVAVTPDSKWIVSGGRDHSIRFWDPDTGLAQLILTGHKNSAISVAVSDTGNIFVTGGGDLKARVWSYSAWSEPNGI